MIKAVGTLGVACLALCAAPFANAGPPAQIHIPGTRVVPESLTSSRDGTVYIGSILAGAVYRARPGSDQAEAWIKPGTAGLGALLGVFADDSAGTLWVCSRRPFGQAPETPHDPSAIYAFNLKTGKFKAKYPLPGADAGCNDMAVAPNGTLYATDTPNMQVDQLSRGARGFSVWSTGFGDKSGVLDGIAILHGIVYVNALGSNKLFAVPIEAGEKAGKITEVTLNRPIEKPDGMRSFGRDSILSVERVGMGRVSRVVLKGTTGTITTLKEGYPDDPVAVTVVGATAYVLESQFKTLRDPEYKEGPYHATALAVDERALAASNPKTACANDSGLTLPPGFCASVFADHLGHARHLSVAGNNVVYVNTWSGRYFGNDMPPPGGFLVALQDTTGSGKADVVTRFGETVQSAGRGGTGIAFYKGFVYAEINDRIDRYALDSGSIVPTGPAQTVVSGLPLDGDHPMHPFVIDADGTLYVDVASASNACQEQNRTLHSPGMNPCAELAVRAGIWRYDANKLGQQHNPGARYATGIRNADGLTLDATGRGLYATQHGRDQLNIIAPELFTAEQGATLPAEELLHVVAGTDAGWPTCYYDAVQAKRVLAPEYGGDGKRVGLCADKQAPAAAFPAHWAPNDVLLYYGQGFPAHYQGGAFIAFHGSWNRAPYAQDGFNIVFQPLVDGKASAHCEIFADGFAGGSKDRGKADHRPAGLALGPDGALYVADDVQGRIYRVIYQGGVHDPVHTTPCPAVDASPGPMLAASGNAAAATANTRPPAVPPGATLAMVLGGDRLYHGAACSGCHGGDGGGSALGPSLRAKTPGWSDGSLAGISRIINSGVPEPKNFRNPMPPMGGSLFSADELAQLDAYVWSLSHEAP